MNDITPIVTPVISLLKSRKFIVGFVGILVSALILLVPDLAPLYDPLVWVITAVALAIIGGIAWEDAAKHGKDAADAENVEISVQLRALMDLIRDHFLPQMQAQQMDPALIAKLEAHTEAARRLDPEALRSLNQTLEDLRRTNPDLFAGVRG